jgi:ASC-1-like (ASCH) protein
MYNHGYMNHSMKLTPEPFDKIANGSKVIELRLFDEKRQRLNLGDTITFLKEPEQTEKVNAKIVGLLRYPTFTDLIHDFPASYFGHSDKTALVTGVHRFYSTEDETRYGVLGIKLELLIS